MLGGSYSKDIHMYVINFWETEKDDLSVDVQLQIGL